MEHKDKDSKAHIVSQQTLLSVGMQLQEAREAKNLTVEQVASKMYLATHTIQDMENDDYENIAETYAKGYLRNYANLLNLNADALVAQYAQVHEPEDRDPVYRSHIQKEAAAAKARKIANVKMPKLFNNSNLHHSSTSRFARIRYSGYVIVIVAVLSMVIWWSNYNPGKQVEKTLLLNHVNTHQPLKPHEVVKHEPQRVKLKKINKQTSQDLTSKLTMDGNY